MTEQAIAGLITRVRQLELRAQRAGAAAAAAQAAAQTAPQAAGGLGPASARSYVQFRTELIAVRRTQMSSYFGGAVPMDIGDLGKGGKGACQLCGKKGHRADRCWHRQKGKESKTGKGKNPKGKAGSQKGPSSSSYPPPAPTGTRPATSKTKCWKCGSTRHLAKDCKSKTAVRCLEQEEQGPTVAAGEEERTLSGPWLTTLEADETIPTPDGESHEAEPVGAESLFGGEPAEREIARMDESLQRVEPELSMLDQSSVRF